MKVVQYIEYGGPEVMHLDEVELPKLSKGQVLVKVKAASINPIDWKIRRGELKWLLNSQFPKKMGVDFSGVVADLADDVLGFRIGDEVFGGLGYSTSGSFSEYVAVNQLNLHRKPTNITLEQAACIPMAGATAWNALMQVAKVHKGQMVLINGCMGGVGAFAVQLAKMRGAYVVGVCSNVNVELAKRIGVDYICDYNQEDICFAGRAFDVILDLSGKLSFAQSKSILKKHGVYLNVVGGIGDYLLAPMLNLFRVRKNKAIKTSIAHEVLHQLYNAAEAGSLNPVIGKEFLIEDAKEALRYLEEGGQVQGKAVFLME